MGRGEFKSNVKKNNFMVVTSKGILSNSDKLACAVIIFDSTSQFKCTVASNTIRMAFR